VNSRLYTGIVWHARREPETRFQYRVWYLSLDLSEIEAVANKLRFFSHNRHNLTSFWNRDYVFLEATPRAIASSMDPSSSPAVSEELITVPRILGHAFNPVSFFLRRTSGTVTGVTAEVHNTWGERHVYTLTNASNDATYVAAVSKAFYVSPFLPEDGDYRFELDEAPGGRLKIKIDLHNEQGTRLFSSGIDARPLPLTDFNLVRLLLTLPFVNLKTIVMIHWQGVRLWLRGVRFHANPSRSKQEGRQLWHKGH
jgi:DUF1365 family protein